METLQVKSRHFNYPVIIGEGAWKALRDFPLDRYSSIFLITEKHLWNRWSDTFLSDSRTAGVSPLFVPRGEASKSLRMAGELAGQLLRQRADRRSLLILFGGGVIGDLGGFVASVYMRGVDCIHVPTTVLAQVDSSMGGKTAVNLGQMKNLIGTFYPPRMVLAEPGVLGTLRRRDFRSGLYEVVKHAILAGPKLFGQVEAAVDSLRPESVEILSRLLPLAAKVKVNVVNRDEHEAGLRMVLNLGHTFGHALEEATRYRRFRHGEAVGWGLLAISRLAQRMGLLNHGEGEQIEKLVWRLGPLPSIRDLSPSAILRLLPQDKKAVGGKLQWVIPEQIGKVRVTADVPPRAVRAALREVQQMRD
ncbi:MAG: 3-dehydroquinate synthase [Terriglobia bacterium]